MHNRHHKPNYVTIVCFVSLFTWSIKAERLVTFSSIVSYHLLAFQQVWLCCLWFYVVLRVNVHHNCIFIFQPCISLPSVNSRYLIDIHGLCQELKYLWRQNKPLSFIASCAVSCLIVIALPLLTYSSYLHIITLSLLLLILYWDNYIYVYMYTYRYR